MSAKKLYRKKEGKMLAGVCAGIAEYLNIDPTIVRLLWIVLSLAYGCGLVIYIICALIVPEENGTAGN